MRPAGERTGAWLLALTSALSCALSCARVETPAALEALDPPAREGSSAPVLSVGGDGRLRLAWTEALEEGGHALRFCVLEGERWSTARTIAQGRDWFVNWADVPALAAFEDGTLVATWLEKLGEGTYAYGVRWARSGDGGASWDPGGFLHEDLAAGEHGFVSLAPLDGDTLRALWLDGRALGEQGGPGEHGGHGAMALYTRTLARDGTLGAESELDARVCDCCPTALLASDGGRALALFRDRGLDERRDLGLLSVDAEGAALERDFPDDGWILDGCPVNGALLARHEATLAAAWFTGAGELPRLRVAFSDDGGESFTVPLEIARDSVLGSLCGTFDAAGTLWLTWLSGSTRDGAARGAWMLRGVDPGVGTPGPAVELVETLPARVSGIARLAHHDARLWFAWVEVAGNGTTRVRAARVARSAMPGPQEKSN
jgi:hypothetical protein